MGIIGNEVIVMLELLKEAKKNMILLAVSCIILGLVLVVYPKVSGVVMCYLIGGFALVYGLVHLIAYIRARLPMMSYRYDLVQGIFGMAMGIYILMYPQTLIELLPVVLGLIVLVDSIVKIQHAWDLKRLGYEQWWIVLIGALAMIVLGFLMINYPFTAYLSIVMFTGMSLIVNGVVDLVTIIILNNKLKSFKDTVEHFNQR